MKRERRILYKLVHKSQNKTGLAETLSYGDFIPELDNRRHLYIKTKYGEDITIKDEQVLGLESVANNFIQLGKTGDKNVELSLMFLTKWNGHTDHYTLDGEISFDELWEGINPQDFISYIYNNKNKKDMVQFMSDLSVFCYDKEETDSALQITLHEKLVFLATLYKSASKYLVGNLLDILKKYVDTRLWVTARGPWEVYKYMKELLDLSYTLLEGSRLIEAGVNKDFGDLLDKLEEIELYPKVRKLDLTNIPINEKVPIKLVTDNMSPIVSNTAIYSTDNLETAIDAIFVHHNRYGDIVNAYKASSTEVNISGELINTENKEMIKSKPMGGKKFNKLITFDFNNNDLTIANVGKDIVFNHTYPGQSYFGQDYFNLIIYLPIAYHISKGESRSVSNFPYYMGDILYRKEAFKSFFYLRGIEDGRESYYANSYVEGDVNQNINRLKVDTLTHHAIIHNVKDGVFTDNVESRAFTKRDKLKLNNYLACQSIYNEVLFGDSKYKSFINDRIYGSNLLGLCKLNNISYSEETTVPLFELGHLALEEDIKNHHSNEEIESGRVFARHNTEALNHNSAGLVYGDNIARNFYGYGSNIFTTSSIFGKSMSRMTVRPYDSVSYDQFRDYRPIQIFDHEVYEYEDFRDQSIMPLRKSKHSNDIGVYDMFNSAVNSYDRVIREYDKTDKLSVYHLFDRMYEFNRTLDVVHGDKYIITNVTMHTNIGNSAKHRYLADNIDYMAMRRGSRFQRLECNNGFLHDMHYLSKLYTDMQYKGDNSIILNVFVREMSSFAYKYYSTKDSPIHLNQALGTKLNKDDFEMVILVKGEDGKFVDAIDFGSSFLLNKNIDGEWLQFIFKEENLNKAKYANIEALEKALRRGYSLVMTPKGSSIKNDVLNKDFNFTTKSIEELVDYKNNKYNKNLNWFMTKSGNKYTPYNSFQLDELHKTQLTIDRNDVKKAHIITDFKQEVDVRYREPGFNIDKNMSFNSDMCIHKSSLDTGNRRGSYTTVFSNRILGYTDTHKKFIDIDSSENFEIPVKAINRNDFVGNMYYYSITNTSKSSKILGETDYTIIGKNGEVISDRKLRDTDGSLVKFIVPYADGDKKRNYNLIDTYGDSLEFTVEFGITTNFRPIYYQESSLSAMVTTDNYLKRTGLSPVWVNHAVYFTSYGKGSDKYYEKDFDKNNFNDLLPFKSGAFDPNVFEKDVSPWLFTNPMLNLNWLVRGTDEGYEEIKNMRSNPHDWLEYDKSSYIFGDSEHIINAKVMNNIKKVIPNLEETKNNYLGMTKSNIRIDFPIKQYLTNTLAKSTLRRTASDYDINKEHNILSTDNEIMDKIRIEFPYHDTTLLAAYIKESTAQLTWDLIIFLMNKYKTKHGLDSTFYINNTKDDRNYKLNIDDINQNIPPHLYEFSLWRDLRLHDSSALSTVIRNERTVHDKLYALAEFEIDFVRMIENYDVNWLNNIKTDLSSIDNMFTKILARLYENIQWETHDAVVIDVDTNANISYKDLYDKRTIKNAKTGEISNDESYQTLKSEVDVPNGRVRKIGVFTKHPKDKGFGINPLLYNMSKLVSIAFAEAFKTIHRIVMDVATVSVFTRTKLGYYCKGSETEDMIGVGKMGYAYQGMFVGECDINGNDSYYNYMDFLNSLLKVYNRNNTWVLSFPEYIERDTNSATSAAVTIETQKILKEHVYKVHEKILSIIDAFMDKDVLNGDPIKYITHAEYIDNPVNAYKAKDECVWFKTNKSMTEILKSEDIGADVKLPNIHMDVTNITTKYGRAMKYVYDTINNYLQPHNEANVYVNSTMNADIAHNNTTLYSFSRRFRWNLFASNNADCNITYSMYEFDKFRCIGAPTRDYPQDRNLIPFKSIDLKRPMDYEIDMYGKAKAFIPTHNNYDVTWSSYKFDESIDEDLLNGSFYSGLFISKNKDVNSQTLPDAREYVTPVVYFNVKLPYIDKHSDRPRFSNLEFKDNEVVLSESSYTLLPEYNKPRISKMFNNKSYKTFYNRISVNYYFYLYQMCTSNPDSNTPNHIIRRVFAHGWVGEMPRSNYMISEMLYDLNTCGYPDINFNQDIIQKNQLTNIGMVPYKMGIAHSSIVEKDSCKSILPILFNASIIEKENNGKATISYNKYGNSSNDLDSIYDTGDTNYSFYGINLDKETIIHHRYLEPRDFYGTLQSSIHSPSDFTNIHERDFADAMKSFTGIYIGDARPYAHEQLKTTNYMKFTDYAIDSNIMKYSSKHHGFLGFYNYASTEENVGLPNIQTKIFTYKPIDRYLPISTHNEFNISVQNYTYGEGFEAIKNSDKSIKNEPIMTNTVKYDFIENVDSNRENLRIYEGFYKKYNYTRNPNTKVTLPDEVGNRFDLNGILGSNSDIVNPSMNNVAYINGITKADIFHLTPLNTIGTAKNGSITMTDDADNCNVELAAHILTGGIKDTRKYKGNNSIFIEKDGNIYLKGGKTYLIRTNASDLVVSKGDKTPITHFPIYNKMEYAGEKSFQGNIILLSDKGNPYVLGNPLLNEIGFILNGYKLIRPNSYGYDNTNLMEMMRYMYSNINSTSDVLTPEIINSFEYKDLNHPILGVMEVTSYEYKEGYSYRHTGLNITTEYELGNQTGNDFANVWYARLAQIDNEHPYAFTKKTFIYPEMTKVSNLKLKNIATEQEIQSNSEKDEVNKKYTDMFNHDDRFFYFNQGLFGYNYGQGVRLTPKEFTVNVGNYNVLHSRATNPIWNTEVYHKNKVISHFEDVNARNVVGSDPYTYKSSAEYYFRLSDKKPKYSTFRLLDQKTGEVKYIRRRYLPLIMYRINGALCVSRNISGYETYKTHREFIEVVVYLSNFNGKTPDDKFNFRAIYSSVNYIDGWEMQFSKRVSVSFYLDKEFNLVEAFKGNANNSLRLFINEIISNPEFTIFIRIPEDKIGTDASPYIKVNSSNIL